jgi:hypothetical protein
MMSGLYEALSHLWAGTLGCAHVLRRQYSFYFKHDLAPAVARFQPLMREGNIAQRKRLFE